MSESDYGDETYTAKTSAGLIQSATATEKGESGFTNYGAVEQNRDKAGFFYYCHGHQKQHTFTHPGKGTEESLHQREHFWQCPSCGDVFW